ncbi:hypothetical protein [Pseudokineococcus lusitanus]|uniref:Uncharacterized protein n=1 Tax=Pseudokineococcus lusitanus TaxID=763993 RepID=A0A3N1GA21_9ACTN|nr:hypothetical protein [Pseudokineococcus lusitanus]ROP27077.1 hypothetical protein EDC03_3005 [Pseudokineococcus lusitanus]
MVLWLTGAAQLAEDVADELWDLLPGARLVDVGPLATALDGADDLEASPGWRALTATAAAELMAWRSERLVVACPLADERAWAVVEAALLRAGLDAVLVAILPPASGDETGDGRTWWPVARADVLLDPSERSAAALAADVTAALGTGAVAR